MSQTLSPDIVKTIPLFAEVAEKDKDALLEAGRIRHFSKKEHLFLHGDPIVCFYIICSGTVQLFRENSDGREKTTDILMAGQTLCKAEIFETVRTHQVNAVAVNEVVVMEFPMAWLKESAKKHTVFALNLITSISEHARQTEIEAEHLATMSAAQQVACFLQRVSILHDFNPCGFELPYSKTLIASRLGMELETLSRTLSKLKENGITVDGTHVTIHDLDGISRFVCSHCSVAKDCKTHQVISRESAARTKVQQLISKPLS